VSWTLGKFKGIVHCGHRVEQLGISELHAMKLAALSSKAVELCCRNELLLRVHMTQPL